MTSVSSVVTAIAWVAIAIANLRVADDTSSSSNANADAYTGPTADQVRLGVGSLYEVAYIIKSVLQVSIVSRLSFRDDLVDRTDSHSLVLQLQVRSD